MKQFDREALERHAYMMRRHIVHTVATNGEGHAGGALSAVDAMAVIFFGVMNFNLDDAYGRDKFLLSGGHKCLALYAALVEAGVVDEKELKTYNQLGTIFPGHPDATKIPQIDFSTGSLGHGLPVACGYAIAAKRLGLDYKTYVLMGDGEQGEGSIWEAAAVAAQHRLDNIVCVLDENTLQINGRTCEVCKPADYEQRYAATGWSVKTVADGHDVGALYEALSSAPFEPGKPSIIIAKTTKGKGISFMEDDIHYHHWNPKADQAAQGIAEIDEYGRKRGWLK